MSRLFRHGGVAALVAGAWVAAGTAHAATFEFSYTYSAAAGGHKMTGTLSGVRDDNGTPLTPTDDFLTAPTVLSAAFNNVAMISSPLLLRRYDDTGMHATLTNVYFNVAANNFIISPCPDATCLINAYVDPWQTVDIFFLRNTAPPNVQFYSEMAPLVAYSEVSTTLGTWSLTEVTAVPEPATYALFICGLAATLRVVRRSRRSSPLVT